MSARSNSNLFLLVFPALCEFATIHKGRCCLQPRFSYLPDIRPATKVEMMGVFLALTRARKEKSRPSRAIAKIIRGRGNMEPRRLTGGGMKKKHIFNVKNTELCFHRTPQMLINNRKEDAVRFDECKRLENNNRLQYADSYTALHTCVVCL